MISKTKLKTLRDEAEHKKAVWGTSVKGCVRFVHLDPRVLLNLLDEFERLKSKTRIAAPARWPAGTGLSLGYLAASGAVPITIIERVGVCSIHTGTKITGTVAARWWINERDAAPVARAARTFAGDRPDLSAATAALHRSAGSLGATLTADDVALGRAADAAKRLDAMIEAMRRDGTLREFNARYRAGRAAALAEGRGFMAFAVAMRRFKRALIPMLMNRQPEAGRMRSIFEEVFR